MWAWSKYGPGLIIEVLVRKWVNIHRLQEGPDPTLKVTNYQCSVRELGSYQMKSLIWHLDLEEKGEKKRERERIKSRGPGERPRKRPNQRYIQILLALPLIFGFIMILNGNLLSIIILSQAPWINVLNPSCLLYSFRKIFQHALLKAKLEFIL